ncbi:MAG TPA: hypothetical protein VKF84_06850 [Candidatus Sulfotelmatobacter sp.]|nr:hypothetical protein [Candidatus Sulfotelmatobacter sp.]
MLKLQQPKFKQWICSALLAVASVAPALAGPKDAADPKKPAETTANPAPGNPASVNSAAQPASAANPNPSLTTGNGNVTALLGVLVMKGVLTPSEANAIRNAAPDAEFQLLVEALARKGVVSAADLSAAGTANPAAVVSPVAAAPAATAPVAVAVSTPAAQAPAPKESKPPAPAVVSAIAPLRVLPVDPPVKDGLKAAFSMGPVKMTPYGFLKATGVYDSSNPNGDDMPFPGLFLATPQVFSTGPTKDPNFHLKARGSRIGANFEFADLSPKITLTGRLEGDFEGNFSEVDNRDVSSIRSSMFSIRQAWARLDYAASDKTDIYFEGGQDWTLFGSSALPNLLETTALAYWYGDVYERSPQFQLGLVQKLGGSRNMKFSPTFAIMMPSSSQIEKLGSLGLQGQIAQAEREGADSGRPELEGRVALQFQVDKAPAVAPAQIIFSGVEGRRTSVVPNSSYCTNVLTCGAGLTPANYVAAFPGGFTASSNIYGLQGALQLPTRWFTLVVSAYRGGDLRFFFAGQVNSFATDTSGLSNIVGGANSTFTGYNPGFSTLDGGPLVAAGGAVLGCNVNVASAALCPVGNVVVAPQRAIRTFGGFVNLGLPISRWFNANPKGRNAGWQLYLHMGKDQVPQWDLHYAGYKTGNANTLAPLPLSMGKLFAATLYYKLNPNVTFGFEQSVYATRFQDGLPLYVIAGQPSNEWQDHRSEFGPIFTF